MTDRGKIRGPAWISWMGVGLLVVLCGVLAILQYRWIGEVAQAERGRLQRDLQSRLDLLRRSFDDQISAACYALVPSQPTIERMGREEAYLEQYRRAQESGDRVVRRIALAIPEGDSLKLRMLEPDRGWLTPSDWPTEWREMRDRLTSKVRREPFNPSPQMWTLVELPRFGPPEGPDNPPGLREQEWLIVELNLDYIRGALLPGMLTRYLGDAGKLDYDAEVVVNENPSESIYRSGPEQDHSHALAADASVTLLEIPRAPMGGFERDGPNPPFGGRRGGGRMMEWAGGRRPPPEGDRRPRPPFPNERPMGFSPERGPDSGRGAWLLRVQHHSGSLEAIVAQARWRNVALSGAILLLILAVVGSLLRLSRQRHQMAELQMNFVAGVSHELRTPLTVIRTAAFNLRGRLANNPDQVERYGRLIQEESEKLTALVESVLRYGSANAGHVIRDREPVAIEGLIEESLRQSQAKVERDGLVFEKHIEAGLPLVLADELALKHAIQNLVDNALKHGTEGNRWIGIFASVCRIRRDQPWKFEWRIAARAFLPRSANTSSIRSFAGGARCRPGAWHRIRAEPGEKDRRGARRYDPGKERADEGTEFIIRIPAAPPELQDEFAHSIS